MRQQFSRCIASGHYLPEKIVTNHDLEKMLDTSHEWIVARTGIQQRHIASNTEEVHDLAFFAAKHLFESSALDPQTVDGIIVATCSSASVMPAAAAMVQKKLDLETAFAFDINVACAGFAYALTIADQFIATGSAQRILVIGAEVMSRTLDWTDRRTCVLFGDGAGAVLVEASETPGIHASILHTTTQGCDALRFSLAPLAAPEQTNQAFTLFMEGAAVFKQAVRVSEELLDRILEKTGFSQDTIDWLIPHQANIRIIQSLAKKLSLPMEQVVCTVAEHGNTSAASIPLAFDIAMRDGRLRKGQRILLESFGAGFSAGAVLLDI